MMNAESKSLSSMKRGPSPDVGEHPHLLVQRRCACGGSGGSHGECEECRKKRSKRTPVYGQAKMAISQPGDAFELEADRVTEQVMRTSEPARNQIGTLPSISRIHPLPQKDEDHDDFLQLKESRSAATSCSTPVPGAPWIVQNVLSSPGKPLDRETRAFMEPRFGHDFSRVRVHTDSDAAESAQAVNALAYTIGSDIVFGSQQYTPQTAAGRKLLGHELVHVIQQSNFSSEHDSSGPLDSRPDNVGSRAGHVKPGITNAAPLSIQRSEGSPAGGCGVCYGNTAEVGTMAHALIEEAFEAQYGNSIFTEFPLLLTPSVGDENGRLDLATPIADGYAIGEIKPANAAGLLQGDLDLFWYEDEIQKYGLHTERMILPPPLAPIVFPNPVPPTCPPQLLFVNPPVHGIYTYFCEPDFKVLVRDPGCGCRDKGEERKKQAEAASQAPSKATAAVPGKAKETGKQQVSTSEETAPERRAPAAQVPPVPKFPHDSWTTLERINGMFEYIVNAPRENSLEVIFDWTSDVRSFLIDFISGYGHALKTVFGIGGSLSGEELDEINRLLDSIDRDAERFHRTGASELLQKIVDTMIDAIQYIHEQTEWELGEDLERGGPYIAAGLVVIALTAYIAAPLIAGAGAGGGTATAAGAAPAGITSTGVPLYLIEGGAAAGEVTIGGSSISATAVTTAKMAAGVAGAVIIGGGASRRSQWQASEKHVPNND